MWLLVWLRVIQVASLPSRCLLLAGGYSSPPATATTAAVIIITTCTTTTTTTTITITTTTTVPSVIAIANLMEWLNRLEHLLASRVVGRGFKPPNQMMEIT